MTLSVRPVAAAEVDALGLLTAQAYDPYIHHEAYRQSLADVTDRLETCTVYVAVDGEGVLLGGVTYVPGPGPYHEFDDARAASIRMLAVDSGRRRTGAGRALTVACLDRARDDGFERMLLHSGPTMLEAHRLYEGLGFTMRAEHDEEWNGVHYIAYGIELR